LPAKLVPFAQNYLIVGENISKNSPKIAQLAKKGHQSAIKGIKTVLDGRLSSQSRMIRVHNLVMGQAL